MACRQEKSTAFLGNETSFVQLIFHVLNTLYLSVFSAFVLCPFQLLHHIHLPSVSLMPSPSSRVKFVLSLLQKRQKGRLFENLMKLTFKMIHILCI